MKIVGICNMKGGVGKTTTAVNLSYLAAAAGHRTLLWDLDPQAASSFAFRVRPVVPGFGKHCLEDGDALGAAIKQTDYDSLYLLPADFAYRKFDRFLSSHEDAERVLTALLAKIGSNFDLIVLDCPAGFSRLTEGIVSAADAIVAPTIPTILSLRMVEQLAQRAGRFNARATLKVFFNMVDRRKTVHRRACEQAAAHGDVFLSAHVPYASAVEQMAARRMPCAFFAPHESATLAFGEIWTELYTRTLRQTHGAGDGRWNHARMVVESLIQRLQSTEPAVPAMPLSPTPTDEGSSEQSGVSAVERCTPADGNSHVVHKFDTEQRDLERRQQSLELHERGHEFVVVVRSDGGGGSRSRERTEARVDRSWAVQILSGELSPVTALERRLGWREAGAVERIRAAAGGRRLQRVETCTPAQMPVAEPRAIA